MSLPNYLAKIKSAGIYRFVWDKSQLPPQQAETMRLVVGYSEKGPFNTPVYIETVADFKAIYGNSTKRLERKGVYFHRLAEQALAAGPILAMNLKPFTSEEPTDPKAEGAILPEKVQTWVKDGKEINNGECGEIKVSDLYDTNRFWTLDIDQIPTKVNSDKYFNFTATDVKDNSCSFFIRNIEPTQYDGITIKEWYNMQSLEMPEYLELIEGENLNKYFAEVYVFRGEFIPSLCEGGLKNYFMPAYRKAEKGETATHIRAVDEDNQLIEYRLPLNNEVPEYVVIKDKYVLNTAYVDAFGEKSDALEALANDPNSNFLGVYSGCTLPYFKDANDNYISLDLKFNADYNKHKMLMKMDESLLDDIDTKDSLNEKIQIIAPEELYPIYLKGYTYTTISKTSSSSDIYAGCVGMLATKGIRTALTNRVDVEYHYLVDTFDSEVNNTKKELLTIAKEKDNAFAILNFPKMSKFVSDTSLATNGKFDITKLPTRFLMPGEAEGASFGAYYTQLTFSDGTVKSVIPSAALVSNLFMEKWGPRQPYYIVAGPTYGQITASGLVGPDYNFGRPDLDVLEPLGVNAIIYVPRKGTYINSNQTAKQKPVSALSKVHIRELVIYLQNEVEYLLQTYQWELNTQTIRDAIKAKADAICETIKNNGGIFEYVNICDETNNTPEVIDNEMIILDTEIEPARGAGKMVHQLTIHKTGGLSSTIK